MSFEIEDSDVYHQVVMPRNAYLTHSCHVIEIARSGNRTKQFKMKLRITIFASVRQTKLKYSYLLDPICDHHLKTLS